MILEFEEQSLLNSYSFVIVSSFLFNFIYIVCDFVIYNTSGFKNPKLTAKLKEIGLKNYPILSLLVKRCLQK